MYEAGNHLLVCAEYSDPELHKHNAAHIMISLNDKIEINTFKEDPDNIITKDLNFWESEEEFNKRLELYNTNYKLISSKK